MRQGKIPAETKCQTTPSEMKWRQILTDFLTIPEPTCQAYKGMSEAHIIGLWVTRGEK